MATFNSIEEIKEDIKKKMQMALHDTKIQTLTMMDDEVQRFYGEYEKSNGNTYSRTEMLKNNALYGQEDAPISPCGRCGYEFEVGYNSERISYSNGGRKGSAAFETAMESSTPHGGSTKFGGDPIWLEFKSHADKRMIDMLKENAIKHGLSIR